MPRDSSGNYTLPGAYNPVVTGTIISSTWANNTLSDIASALTDSLDRSGRGGMLAPFKMADGTVLLPGLAFNNETTTGFYRPSAGVLGISVLGVNALSIDATQALFAKIPRFASAPVGSTDLANKAYVDAAAGGAAAAGSLTGTTLAANVVNSSLTSLGTLTGLTVVGTTTLTGNLNITGGIGATGGITAGGGFVGNLTGNVSGNASTASLASALTPGRNINGVLFDGTANITVAAAAGTLTGTALPGTITSAPGLAVNNPYGAAGTVLGGGLIVKYGTTPNIPTDTDNVVVTFATPFPNACIAVVGSCSTGYPVGGSTEAFSIACHTFSTTGFLVDNDATDQTITWVAFGH